MEQRKTTFALRATLVVALTATAFIGGYAYSQKNRGPADAVNPMVSVAAPATNGGTASGVGTVLADFSAIAAEQGPAVVNISVSGTTKAGYPGFPQLDPNDPIQEFLRRFYGPTQRGTVPTHGLGSGFIVSADGVVLTNAHVVAEADEVIIKLTDKREFKAKVVGLDKLSDVAVLRIEAKNLPVVKIGDPKRIRPGEWVVAVGSPFGFDNTVTAGIVSATSRSLPDEGYVPFLQTDVAINPGNSGGPLFNMRGEVIGINSQIYSRSGGYQGLSFAIPIDVAMKVERQLLEHGKVSRGRLGISVQNVTQDLAESFSLPKPAGALVGAVEKDSPAEKAGIEPGDVITRFNGTAIDRSSELPPLVTDMQPGAKATVTLWHKGKTKDVSVVVGELKTAAASSNRAPTEGDKGKLGLAVRPLTPNERSEANVVSGLMVEGVGEGPAEKAGIQPGDVIVSINGELVSDAEQLRAKTAKSGKLALLVIRGNSRLFVPINVG
ncbi:MAG: DegQ family serine endoprotease [Pseudomonadota bacterium]